MDEVPNHEHQYMPHVYDALRALTIDVSGSYIPRDELGRAICHWLISRNRPTPPKGALNRIMKRAEYPRHGSYFRGIQLRTY